MKQRFTNWLSTDSYSRGVVAAIVVSLPGFGLGVMVGLSCAG